MPVSKSLAWPALQLNFRLRVPNLWEMTTATALTREAIVASAGSLPAAPQVMARLYTLLLDFNAGLKSIADLLKRDLALTTRVIRIANSPAFGSVGVGTIEEALQRVGYGEVYRLVGLAANASLAETQLRCYGFTNERYRRHNLFSALVAEQLAPRVCVDARSAYTAGLLRRIGQLLLDRAGRGRIGPHATFAEAGQGRLVEWERQHFGTDHYVVAGVLLEEWKFPAAIVEAVRHAHGDGGELSPLGQVIDLTDNIVRFAGFGLSTDESEWGLPSEKIEALGMDLETVKQAQTDALARLMAVESAG